MANRFFKPGQHQYRSQFVPTQLPLDMMMQGLSARQTKYDTRLADIYETRGKFNERAVFDDHKQYILEKEAEYDQFVSDISQTDLSSSQYYSEYTGFINKFNNDDKLASVRKRVENYDAYAAERRKLQEAGTLNMARDYRTTQMLNGMSTGELDFDNTLSGLVIGDEVDATAAYQEYFNHIKASGSEEFQEIEDRWYKVGWKGITPDKIGEAALTGIQSFMASPAGRQELMRYDMQVDQGLIDPEEMNSTQFIYNELLKVGSSYTTFDDTIDFNKGLNESLGGSNSENDSVSTKPGPQDPIVTIPGTEEDSTNDFIGDFGIAGNSHGGNHDLQTGTLQTANQNIALLTTIEDKLFNNVVNWSRDPDSYLPTAEEALTQEEYDYLNSIPGGIGASLINGESIDSADMMFLGKYMTDQIVLNEASELHAQNNLRDMDVSMTQALEENMPSTQYGGATAAELMRDFYEGNYTTGDLNEDISMAHEDAVTNLWNIVEDVYNGIEQNQTNMGFSETSPRWMSFPMMKGSTEAVLKYEHGENTTTRERISQYIMAGFSGETMNAPQFTRQDAVESVEQSTENMMANLIQDLGNGIIGQNDYVRIEEALQTQNKLAYTELARVDIEEAKYLASQLPNEQSAVRDSYNQISASNSERSKKNFSNQSRAIVNSKSLTYSQRLSDGTYKTVDRVTPIMANTLNIAPDSGIAKYYRRTDAGLVEIPANDIIKGSVKITATDLSNPSNYDFNASFVGTVSTGQIKLNEEHLAMLDSEDNYSMTEEEIKMKYSKVHDEVIIRLTDNKTSETYLLELERELRSIADGDRTTQTGKNALEAANNLAYPALGKAQARMQEMEIGEEFTFQHQMPVAENVFRASDTVRVQAVRTDNGIEATIFTRDLDGRYVPSTQAQPFKNPAELIYMLQNTTSMLQGK